MSLNQHTKCDLSGEKAVIDLSAMTAQIEKRLYNLISTMNKKMSDVRENSFTIEGREKTVLSIVAHENETIIRLAKDIAETSELLHTLYNRGNGRKIELTE